jgi:hypothetical protein
VAARGGRSRGLAVGRGKFRSQSWFRRVRESLSFVSYASTAGVYHPPPGDGVASLLGGGVASFVRTQGRQSHPKTKTAVNG